MIVAAIALARSNSSSGPPVSIIATHAPACDLGSGMLEAISGSFEPFGMDRHRLNDCRPRLGLRPAVIGDDGGNLFSSPEPFGVDRHLGAEQWPTTPRPAPRGWVIVAAIYSAAIQQFGTGPPASTIVTHASACDLGSGMVGGRDLLGASGNNAGWLDTERRMADHARWCQRFISEMPCKESSARSKYVEDPVASSMATHASA